MRVRISYSVDLDDVPNECSRMLAEALEKLGDIHRDIESLIDQLDTDAGVGWQVKDKITRCRQSLAKIDSVMVDNDMILEGYYGAKNKKEDEDVVDEG
jgi:hypothetical protein